MGKKNKQTDFIPIQNRVFIAYYLTIAACLFGMFFPELRLWGFNQWTFFSAAAKLLIASIALMFPFFLRNLFVAANQSSSSKLHTFIQKRNNFLKCSLLLVFIMLLAFWLLRAKTHFLGDGYLNLASLASDNPLVKETAYGETMIHIWLKSIIGGNNEATSLLTFQIISILSGIFVIAAALFFSLKLFDSKFESFLFSLGMIFGGFMLLSFGYVEYYSLFVLSVIIFTFVGLLIASNLLNRWLILPFLLLTIFFHILGVTLIPCAVYLLISKSTATSVLDKLSPKSKWLSVGIVSAVLLAIYYYIYSSSYKFRFAVLPIFPDEFTVEGYTLFSINHIVDYLNLLFLLVPGLLVFAVIFSKLSLNDADNKVKYFFAVLIVSTLGAVFLLDPKLGMPRDWDLLSFCGVPLSSFIYYSILKHGRSNWTPATVLLMVTLSTFSLIPRAVRQTIPDMAIAEFKSYAVMDVTKNRVARNTLIDYLREAGRFSESSQETTAWFADYPERAMLLRADSLLTAKSTIGGIMIVREILDINPYYPPAYYMLGLAYLDLNKLDSAIKYLEIANAMNPGNAQYMETLVFAKDSL